MKKIICSLVVVLLSFNLMAQTTFGICTNVDGMWSSWRYFSGCLYGSYGQILQYNYGTHPAEFIWRFTINSFYSPQRNDQWLEFSGTMEYYISDKYPDARSQFLDRRQQGFVVAPYSKNQGQIYKKTSNAIIKIGPYKGHPQVYNIFFDGVGFGLDLNGTYFGQR